MTSQIEGATRTFQASAALAKYCRVRLDGSYQLAYAGAANTDCIGVMAEASLAADDYVSVRLPTAEGTQIMIAHDAIAIGAPAYAAASGRVAAAGTVLVGEALTASTAAGDWIEIMLSPEAILGAIARTALTQDDAVVYAVPLTDLRKWDDFTALLPGTGATDDLALIEGTFGTAAPMVQSADSGATSVTAYARFQFAVPAEYVDGQTITLRALCSMLVISDTTATLDVECYRQAAPSVDICATAATTINSATPANKDFTITPTNVVTGDMLDIRLTVAIVDGATGAPNVTAVIETISMLLDIKG